MITMQRLIFMLAVSSALLAVAPTAAPNVATFPVSATVLSENPDYYLGIAVLGHHVARVENHYLIKPPPGSMLHIDWSGRGPSWTTFTPGPESEYDVSPKQLEAAVGAVEALGVPAAAIHARMATAPVGYDNDHANTRTLQVGQILVDLGPYAQAVQMWKKFDRPGSQTTFDEFETKNHVNMPFIQQIFFGTDCAGLAKRGHDALVANAEQQAHAITSASGINLSIIDIAQHSNETPLCPIDQLVDVSSTQYTPPDLAELSSFSFAGEARYAMATTSHWDMASAGTTATTREADYYPEPTLLRVSTADRYVATDASVSVDTQPDAGAISFTYRYNADQHDLDARIAQLSSLGIAAQDVLKRGPHGSRNETTILVRLDPLTSERANQIQAILQTGMFKPTIELFKRSCDGKAIALQHAIAESRAKAEAIAGVLHAAVGEPIAITIPQDSYEAGECGADTSTIESLSKSKWWGVVFSTDSWTTRFTANVEVAWRISADAHVRAPSKSASYTGSSALHSCAKAELAALKQAVEAAMIDLGSVKSLAEGRTSLSRDYRTTACKNTEETLMVVGDP